MDQRIQIRTSGIKMIDESWGGLYWGGTYLLIGAHKSGRTTLALEIVKECAQQKEVCLYFTLRRPKDLILHSASINFDLQQEIQQNKVILIKIDSSINLADKRETDLVLAEYIKDIIGLVEQYKPARIVFDELTPFIGFKDIRLLEETFAQTIEAIEDLGVTSLFLLGDPITPSAEKLVEILASHSTGMIYLQKKENVRDKYSSGIMTITPNVGHPEGKFKSDFKIVPGKGFVYSSQDLPTSGYLDNAHSIITESRYKSLSEISSPKDEHLVSNLYSYEDFGLILNNQIAYYKSTGQLFTLVSFKLDESLIKVGAITLNQLQNAVRLSVEKKDKICVVANKVIVLFFKEDQKDISGLVARVKSNLSSEDNAVMTEILSKISVYAVRVDESVKTSDDMLKEIRSDEIKGKNKINLS